MADPAPQGAEGPPDAAADGTPEAETDRPLEGIDRLIHEPARMVVMAILSEIEGADFLFLRRQTGLTAGNLSSHLSRLEEADYIEVEKTFRGKVPQTLLRITPAGRRAFAAYRDSMSQMLGIQ